MGVALTLLASPAWAAGADHLSSIAVAWSAAGQLGFGASDARKEADQLLKQAKSAVAENKFDQAEQLLARAEKLGVKYDPITAKIVDTPESVRRDLTAARAKKPAGSSRLPSLLSGDASKAPASPPGDPFARRAAGEAAIASMTDDSKAKAKQWVDLGRQALAQGNMAEAQGCYQKAAGYKATFGAGEYSPDQLAAELQKAGVTVAQPAASGPANSPFALRPSDIGNESDKGYPSAKTPSSPSRYNSAFGEPELNPNNLPPERNPLAVSPQSAGNNANGSQPIGRNEPQLVGPAMQRLPGVESERAVRATIDDGAKAEAQRLTAQARALKDRGDFDNAYRLAEKAQSLNVPESAYGRDETRPWQILVEINRELARRGGVQQAAGAQDNRNGGDFPVANGAYDPSRDNTRVVPVQGEGLAPQVIAGNPIALKAENLFDEGIDALQNGDREAAIAKFQEAWKFQDSLDPQRRQDLKDKLALLRASAGPAPRPLAPSQLPDVNSEQHLRYQKFLREVSAERDAAQKLANDNPRQAISNLRELRERVAGADLEPAGRKQLLTILDRSSKELESFLEQNRGDIEQRERNRDVQAERIRDREMTIETQNKLAELVEKFNRLMDENRYPEAEVLAKQARELAPNSSIAEMLTWKSHFAKNVQGQLSIKDRAERGFVGALEAVDESKVPMDDRNPISFGDVTKWSALTRDRKRMMQEMGRKLSPAEMEIEKSLGKQVEVNFSNSPLSEVLDTLSKMAGINIHLDPQGLHSEAVTSDTPVTLNLTNPVSLKSALNLLLGQLRLSYVIENEVLLITSKDTRDSHTYTKVYYVADLVTPIPNFVPSYNIGLPGAIRESFNAMGYGPGNRSGTGSIPLTLGQNDAGGQANQNASVLAQMAGAQMQGKDGSPFPIPHANTRASQPNGGYGPGGLGGGVIADFDTLIDLITSTITPDSWVDNGGQGSISGFPTNLSLVVSQTQDIHADIADLLQQLRRLQDLQVTIEVRFITLQDNFFERIGIDFDFRVDDNSGLALPPNTVTPDDNGQSYAIGLGPNGQPTSDLDFAFTQDTFGSAVPQFGGFDPSSAANFGFAILSDIEVFFLLQAIQGDTRTNVLQAPKVTLFNGQQAFVRDSTDRPFVTQIIPVVGDFAAAQQPVVTVLSEGTSLSVQAVVSSDRRFVRLTLVPMFTKIGDVSTFTFNGKTTSNTGTTVQDPTDPTKKVTNGSNTTTEGTTVQLPSLNVTTVSTTVSVPDGGTVLLGGIKRLQEGRNERGVPLLSKIPYVSRLFKNVGIGRTTQSLMMMVTPRIIIQEEEEEKLGLDLAP